VLAIASWVYILSDGDSGFGDLFSADGWRAAAGFVGDLAGQSRENTPAFLQRTEWIEAAKLAYRTLAMSVLAIAIAGAGVLITFLPAARRIGSDEAAASRSPLWRALYLVVRGIFIVTRGVPELLMAMIVVFFFSPGILPGAIALGLHNYGIVGKLSAEVVEHLDPRPARALQSAGAGRFQVLFYGIMPQALPQFLTYLLYRWEVVIRTTIVVGFVGAGGLGREFRLDMSFFRYTDVALLLVWYVVLVVVVDLVSMYLRRLAR
jgi:phosphonate transport system permease protein